MTCEFCQQPDCGVCTDCDVPHSKCLPCRGSASPPTRAIASGPVPQTMRCANCGHTAAVHSLDGRCLLAEKIGQPQLRTLQLGAARGWKHCACKEFKPSGTVATGGRAAAKQPAPPPPVTDDDEDEDAIDSEDAVDPSELDVVE